MAVDPWRAPEWQLPHAEWSPPPPREPALRPRGDGRTAVVTAVFVALAGQVAGLVWATVAPQLAIARAIQGDEVAFKAQVGADVAFLAVGAAAGVICAAVAVIGFRLRGPGLVAGLAVGGVGAAFVADRVGNLVDRASTLAAIHAAGVAHPSALGVSLLDLRVRALGVVVAWPVASLVVAGLVEAIGARRR